MTGEITLRGRVLPIGGLKSKILAAHLSGAKMVILPRKNEKDLRDIPEEIRKQMKLVLVDSMDQVLEAALRRKPQPLKSTPVHDRGDPPSRETPAAPATTPRSRPPSSRRRSRTPAARSASGRAEPGATALTAPRGWSTATTTPRWVFRARPARPTSRRPSASLPASTILTSTRATPAPRSASRRSARPTRSSPTPRSARLYDQLGANWEAYQRAGAGAGGRRTRSQGFAGCRRPAPVADPLRVPRRPRGPRRLHRLLPHVLRRRRDRWRGGGIAFAPAGAPRTAGVDPDLEPLFGGIGWRLRRRPRLARASAPGSARGRRPDRAASRSDATATTTVTLEEVMTGHRARRPGGRQASRGARSRPGVATASASACPARPTVAATSTSRRTSSPTRVFTRDGANLEPGAAPHARRGAPRRRGPRRDARRASGSC